MKKHYELIRKLIESKAGQSIRSKSREQYICDYRFVYFKLCKTLIEKFTLKDCGAEVNRDHSTVLYGLTKFYELDGMPYFGANGIYEECCNFIISSELMPQNKKHIDKIINQANDVIDNLFVEYELITA